ncbi:MAG TPA: hypothetical protein VGH74_03615, partial [Planctomycetaceae bacterium]
STHPTRLKIQIIATKRLRCAGCRISYVAGLARVQTIASRLYSGEFSDTLTEIRASAACPLSRRPLNWRVRTVSKRFEFNINVSA